jgi:hypothetical protein
MIFIPDTVFLPGETVTVQWLGGMPAGARDTLGACQFTFTVSVREITNAELASGVRRMAADDPTYIGASTAVRLRKTGPAKSASVSDGDLPPITIDTSNHPTPGTIYWSSYNTAIDTMPSYLLVSRNDGSLADYLRMDAICLDFRPQADGKYTYFDWGTGLYCEVDSSLTNVIKTYGCVQGFTTDQHDMKLLPNGHVILLGQDPELVWQGSFIPGGQGWVTALGLVIQEIDGDGNLIFQWRSNDYFNVSDAVGIDLTEPTIDYVHGNAIDLDTDGNIVLSSRHLDEITKINRTTGAIMWRWGGKHNEFTFINDTIGFSHQHDIRVLPNGNMTLFDNGNMHSPQVSRACEYTIDQQHKTATLVWQYTNPVKTYSSSMGSVQRLKNGNTVIGWGSTSSPAVTEVTPAGVKTFEMSLPENVINYRAYRNEIPVVTTVASHSAVTIPGSYVLEQNYPNPFNPSTVITYTLPAADKVVLRVYDLLGHLVQTLVNENEPAGRYSVQFNGGDLSSGLYFCQLSTPHFMRTLKMTLIR